MNQPNHPVAPFVRSNLARALAALSLCAAIGPLCAQIPQASYPLLTDLLDATATYTPMILGGSTPPAPPSNGVCINGVYALSPGGQDLRTPVITSLDANDFQVSIDFNITALPANQGPIFVGGNGYRWIGFYVQASGTLGVLYNNANFTWSTTAVTTGTWYTATIKYEAGGLELFLDGLQIHQTTLPALNTGNNLNFTSNNYSNATNFHGCVRNLLIANDTTLGQSAMAAATNFGDGCDGLSLDAMGLPTVGNAGFALIAGNVPIVSPVAFLAFGSASVSPGLDLTGLGMAGCTSNTTFDLGLFGPEVVSSSAANFPLPIPAQVNLVGSRLAAQAVSFSAATTFGLAASNGTKMTIGL